MGISSVIEAGVSLATELGSAAAAGAEALGAGAGLGGAIGTGITGAVEGAELGGLTGGLQAGLTGHDILSGIGKGALGGGITGGIGAGFGGPLGEFTGLGETAGRTLATAAGGGLGALATGGDPLKGAVMGGVEGFAGLGGSGAHLPSPTGGVAATASAAPAGIASAPDLSSASGHDLLTGGSDSFISGSPGSGALSAPSMSTLPGDIGKGAASGAASAVGPGSGITSLGAEAPVAAINPTGALTQPPGAGALATDKPSFMSSLGAEAKAHPLGALAAGAQGLALLEGNRPLPNEGVLRGEASRLGSQGRTMENYLASGTLPPGFSSALHSADSAAKAAIRAQYAAHGIPNSSAEAQDLAAESERTVAQSAEIATKLFQEGLSATGMSDQIYMQLMQEQIAQDSQLSGAVGNLSSAIALMSRPPQPGA